MGGNASEQVTEGTAKAYTLYGFGFSRCCSKSEFLHGAPKNTCCGTSGATHSFAQDHILTSNPQAAKILQQLEDDLPTAAHEASPHISWWSHVFCSALDATAESAATALNQGWCRQWNEKELDQIGLKCVASSEAYGFGRSRATYLVLRIMVNQ